MSTLPSAHLSVLFLYPPSFHADFFFPCSAEFLDDNIEDDIRCAKIIAKEANGLSRW